MKKILIALMLLASTRAQAMYSIQAQDLDVNLALTVQSLVLTGTATIQGQNASGYSLSVSSSISAQCINLQGGQICGPSTGGGGGAVTTTSASTFTTGGSLAFAPGSFLTLNSNDGVMFGTSGESIWAKSASPVSDVAGCVVAVSMSDTLTTGFAVFSSTNVAQESLFNPRNISAGVLLEACAPGNFCRVGISGIYRVTDDDPPGTSMVATQPAFSATRCYVSETAVINGTPALGQFVNTITGAGGEIYIKLVR